MAKLDRELIENIFGKEMTDLLSSIETIGKRNDKPGKCPICGCEHIKYSSIVLNDEYAYFPWECPNCENVGKEYYHLEFLNHEVFGYDD